MLCAASVELPMGRSNTFFPVACSKVMVTGMDPPSLVMSGSMPKTSLTALAAAVKFQCFGEATHHLPSCWQNTSSEFLDCNFANSERTYLKTASLTAEDSM